MKKFLICLLFFILCMIQLGSTTPSTSINPSDYTKPLPEYINHEPIIITDNSNFSSLGFPGDGTVGNPYIIQGYNITGEYDSLINITHTNVHFRIENNWLSGIWLKGSTYGILLESTDNGIINNNRIQNTLMGINLATSDNNRINNNTVCNCFGWGIRLAVSNNNIIQGNKIFGCGDVGIELKTFSSNNTISDNFIHDNFEGLAVKSSSNNTISGNYIVNNSLGIHVLGIPYSPTANNSIFNNFIATNSLEGIILEETTINNMIKWNDFANNNLDNDSQATDNGTDNIFFQNFWMEWKTPDNNNDGIVDQPYSISGSSNNLDLFPLAISNVISSSPTPPTNIILPISQSESNKTTNTTSLDLSLFSGLMLLMVALFISLNRLKSRMHKK